jgi:hypothetical protein
MNKILVGAGSDCGVVGDTTVFLDGVRGRYRSKSEISEKMNEMHLP